MPQVRLWPAWKCCLHPCRPSHPGTPALHGRPAGAALGPPGNAPSPLVRLTSRRATPPRQASRRATSSRTSSPPWSLPSWTSLSRRSSSHASRASFSRPTRRRCADQPRPGWAISSPNLTPLSKRYLTHCVVVQVRVGLPGWRSSRAYTAYIQSPTLLRLLLLRLLQPLFSPSSCAPQTALVRYSFVVYVLLRCSAYLTEKVRRQP